MLVFLHNQERCRIQKPVFGRERYVYDAEILCKKLAQVGMIFAYIFVKVFFGGYERFTQRLFREAEEGRMTPHLVVEGS